MSFYLSFSVITNQAIRVGGYIFYWTIKLHRMHCAIYKIHVLSKYFFQKQIIINHYQLITKITICVLFLKICKLYSIHKDFLKDSRVISRIIPGYSIWYVISQFTSTRSFKFTRFTCEQYWSAHQRSKWVIGRYTELYISPSYD